MEVFADVVTNPTFPPEELDRKKKQYVAQILQEKRQPLTTTLKSFFKTLYGQDHPYGQPFTGSGTEESINSITRNDLEKFYKTYFRPNNATLIVVGDITAEEIVPILENALKEWGTGSVPTVNVPEIKKFDGSHVYLIDKPGAAQSVIVTGHFGLKRNSPDFFKVEVLNTILGGKFTSRLNMNLREDKGYTYGAGSAFWYYQGLGPFIAYTQVHTQYTKESLSEIVKEFKGIAGAIPLGEEELADTKNYITLRYPQEFETISQIGENIREIVTYDLPNDYFNQYVSSIGNVSGHDVKIAAAKYITTANMLYVIMGDVDKIESGIKELNLGEIHYLDLDGNPLQR